MAMNREFFNRDTNITASILRDSVNEKGQRMTSFELEYPRFLHCFDESTEVLARIGDSDPEFMLFKKAMALNAEVAQYDKDSGEVSFVLPDEYIENIGSHKMVKFSSNKLSLSVTDKHRMLVDKRTTGNTYTPEVWTADAFLGEYVQCRLRQSGEYVGKQYYSKEELALMVWFASDGASSGNDVFFHFRKVRKVDSVKKLLVSLGIDFKYSKYEDSWGVRFTKPSWVSDCYTEAGFKKLPKYALYMDMESYEFVKKAILESDGSVTNSDFNNCSKVYAEQVQILAHLHNDSMNLKYYDKDGASRLYKSKFKVNPYISLRRDKDVFDSEVVESTVYCVSVKTKFIMVRRDGVVHISGNCELMTHRTLSKNCSSSRAIPIEKMIEYTNNNVAMPVYWGKKKKGMQASEEVDVAEAESAWLKAYQSAVESLESLNDIDLHKQVANRVIEPFQMMKVVLSGTDFDNFFNLRLHKDTLPEFVMLVQKMYTAMEESRPNLLRAGEWHLPYVEISQTSDLEDTYYFYYETDNTGTETDGYQYEIRLTLEEALRMSTASCASVSYRTESLTEKAIDNIFNMLIKAEVVHSSPLEHQATPITASRRTMSGFDDNNLVDDVETWEKGITHMKRTGDLCSGNLTGFIQHRHLLSNNTCYEFDYDKRMEGF